MHVGHRQFFAALAGNYLFAFGVEYGYRRIAVARDIRFGVYRAVFARDGRGDFKPARTVVVEIEVYFVYNDQIHVAVYSAVERKVRGLRIYFFGFGVVHAHAQQVCIFYDIGDAYSESGITTVVARYKLVVEINLRGRVDALKLEIHILVGRCFRRVQRALEHKCRAQIIAAAVLSVDAVPRIWQVERRGVFVRGAFAFGIDSPVVVDTGDFSHDSLTEVIFVFSSFAAFNRRRGAACRFRAFFYKRDKKWSRCQTRTFRRCPIFLRRRVSFGAPLLFFWSVYTA